MKNVIKFIAPVALMMLFVVSGTAQVSATKVKEGKQCDPKACTKVFDAKNCDPKLCDALMPQCKGIKSAKANAQIPQTSKTTKVASAVAERLDVAMKPACNSKASKKCCAKKDN